jgi:aminoacrylate peracid reductase
MSKQVIVPRGSPPLAPYLPGILAGNILYIAGTVSLDSDGELANDVRKQTRQVLDNIRAVLNAAGASFADIFNNTIYLKTYDDYAAMNEVYREYFSSAQPARACIKAELVKPDFLVKIVSIAHLPDGR